MNDAHRPWTKLEASYLTAMLHRYGNLDKARVEEMERRLAELKEIDVDPFYAIVEDEKSRGIK